MINKTVHQFCLTGFWRLVNGGGTLYFTCTCTLLPLIQNDQEPRFGFKAAETAAT
jgi:hypothetical protein